MNLLKNLHQITKSSPDQEAIIYQDKTWSYEDLWQSSLSLANGLLGFGLQQEDRVFVVLPNCPEVVISFYGILTAESILIPTNPAYTAEELSTLIADAKPSLIITNSDTAQKVEKSLEKAGLNKVPFVISEMEHSVPEKLHYSFEELLKSPPLVNVNLEQEEDRVIEILYTSGTTGKPKGAMLTHKNLYTNTKSFAEETEMSSADRSLLVAPAYHIAAQTCLMNNTLFAGGALVIHDGWHGPEQVLKTIHEEKITFFFGPPTMYNFIIYFPEIEKYDVSSLRVAFTGAAPLSAEVFKKFKEIFGFEIMEGYGLSETSPVNCTNPYRGKKKIGSVGPPFVGVEVKIFDENDHELPRGEAGEICVRGPNVMKGYFNKKEETDKALRNGWFHTEDIGYMDEENYVFIVDRKKDMIIRGGMNIYPRQIEEVLYSYPGIIEAAVVGVKDEVMGEEVKAIVVTEKEIDIEDLKNYCRDKLVKYKIPRYYEVVDSLPKTTTGKILKRELRG